MLIEARKMPGGWKRMIKMMLSLDLPVSKNGYLLMLLLYACKSLEEVG
jgi:hypothetical protein